MSPLFILILIAQMTTLPSCLHGDLAALGVLCLKYEPNYHQHLPQPAASSGCNEAQFLCFNGLHLPASPIPVFLQLTKNPGR